MIHLLKMYFYCIFSKIMYSDLQTISPEQYMKQITKRLTEIHAVSVSVFISIREFISDNPKVSITESRRQRSTYPNPRISLPIRFGIHCWCLRCDRRIPHRLGQNQDAKPTNRCLHWWINVSQQLGLLQKSHSTRGSHGPLSRSRAPTDGCSPRKGYKTDGKR